MYLTNQIGFHHNFSPTRLSKKIKTNSLKKNPYKNYIYTDEMNLFFFSKSFKNSVQVALNIASPTGKRALNRNAQSASSVIDERPP